MRGGTVAEACKELGISRKTYYLWLKKYTQAPNRIKTTAMAGRYRNGKEHPRSVRHLFKKQVLAMVGQHPEWSHRRITAELKASGKAVSEHAIQNLLKDLGLEIAVKRQTMAEKYQVNKLKGNRLVLRLRLNPEVRKQMIEEVILQKHKIADV
jgi:transposase